METNRRRDPKYLKSLLYTRINQHKMLNNTLCEMISKNASSRSIEMLKEELNGIVTEMENINKDLEKLKNSNEEEVTYSFYDRVTKAPSKTCFEEKIEEEKKKEQGFYDSIIKQNKTCQCKLSEDVKNENKYNYENIYKKIRKDCEDKIKAKSNNLTNKFVDDFRNTADSRLQENRFLVDLKTPLSIPEIMVKSMSFDITNKRVVACIYDFVVDFDGKKYPILEILKHAPTSFSFTIKRLECDGKVQYTEYYSGCRIYEVFRDPIDYASDDFSKIQIFIAYHDVVYEASN